MEQITLTDYQQAIGLDRIYFAVEKGHFSVALQLFNQSEAERKIEIDDYDKKKVLQFWALREEKEKKYSQGMELAEYYEKEYLRYLVFSKKMQWDLRQIDRLARASIKKKILHQFLLEYRSKRKIDIDLLLKVTSCKEELATLLEDEKAVKHIEEAAEAVEYASRCYPKDMRLKFRYSGLLLTSSSLNERVGFREKSVEYYKRGMKIFRDTTLFLFPSEYKMIDLQVFLPIISEMKALKYTEKEILMWLPSRALISGMFDGLRFSLKNIKESFYSIMNQIKNVRHFRELPNEAQAKTEYYIRLFCLYMEEAGHDIFDSLEQRNYFIKQKKIMTKIIYQV